MSSAVQPQPLPADHLDVEAAVLVGLDRGHLHHAADPVHRVHAVRGRPRSPPGSPRSRTAASTCRRSSAGGAPARGSGPRRRAAARVTPGNITVFSGKIGQLLAHAAQPTDVVRASPPHEPPGRRSPCAAPRLAAMIRRIDLRGRTRSRLPRRRAARRLRRRGRPRRRAPDLRRRPPSRRRGDHASTPAQVRPRRADRHRGAASRRSHEALDELDPAVRAGLEESIRRLRDHLRGRARAGRRHRRSCPAARSAS